MFPSPMSPKVSEATVLVMFIDWRCSMIALALPSRSLETVKACSFSTSSFAPPVAPTPASVLTSSMSRRLSSPARTTTVTATGAVPV